MELLLWLWFYDTRWLFDFKVSIIIYKNIWLIPLFMHLFLTIVCIYYLQIQEVFECDASLRLWLYTRTFFSFILVLNIIFFMLKISDTDNKEQAAFDKAVKITPALENKRKQYDFWIRRKSLLSTPGILLLFLGVVSLFWSILIISLYHFKSHFFNCEMKIQKLLNTHSFFIILGNVPLALIVLSMLIIKLGSLLSAILCPNFLIALSKCCSKKEVTARLIRYD